MNNDEWLWVVNEADEPVGRMLRSEAYRDGRKDFRVVNAFLVNSKGQVWIPKRSPTKQIFPDALDVSVGGHVEYDEPYDLALYREAMEELTIDLDVTPWHVLGKLTPRDGVSAFMTVYVIESNDTPIFNPDDFVSAEWMTPKDALALLATGVPAKSDLAPLLKYFIANHG